MLGLAFSARKKLILEYAALGTSFRSVSVIVGGVLLYQEMTDEYGTCLFGLCQLPDSDLASTIRNKSALREWVMCRVFQEAPRSRSADFLRA